MEVFMAKKNESQNKGKKKYKPYRSNSIKSQTISNLIKGTAKNIARSAVKGTPSSYNQAEVQKLANKATKQVQNTIKGTANTIANHKVSGRNKNNRIYSDFSRETLNRTANNLRKATTAGATKRTSNDLFGNSYLRHVPSPTGIGSLSQDLSVKQELDFEEVNNDRISKTHAAKEYDIAQIFGKADYVQDDMMAWWEDNTVTVRVYNKYTKKYEKISYLKPNAQPPCKLNAEEQDSWDYYIKYNRAKAQTVSKAEHEAEERNKRTANYSDYSMKTNNSYADIIRSFINDSAKKGFGVSSTNLLKNTANYFSNYVFNPLTSGEFGILANNVLVNLGETMDLLGVGARAAFGSKKTVYGSGDRLIEGQDYWVYSGGKETQKKLVKLGAYDLVKYGGTDSLNSQFSRSTNASKLKAIEEAGLMDEYLKFKEEYEKANLKGKPLQAIKDAYTSHKNYSADTGNAIGNIYVETVLDPSLVVGGLAKGVATSGSKTVARSSTKASLETVLRNPKRVEKILDQTEDFSKSYFKDLGENMFSAKTRANAIERNVDSIGTLLESKKLLNTDERRVFETVLTKNLKKQVDTGTFRLIQGVKALDKGIDKIDSTLLKSVFAAPYFTYKGSKAAYKALRKTNKFREYAMKQASERVLSGLRNSDNTATISNIEDYLESLGAEYLVDEDDALFKKTFKAYEDGFSVNAKKFTDLKKDFTSGKYDVRDLEDAFDDEVMRMTQGKFSTASEFSAELERLQFDYLGSRNEVSKLSNQYLQELRQVKQVIDSLKKVKLNELFNQLSSISDAENFIKFYNEALEYKTILPSDFLSDMQQLSEGFDVKTVKGLICDYELKNNVTLKKAPATVKDTSDLQTSWDNSDLVMKGSVSKSLRKEFDNLKPFNLNKVKVNNNNKFLKTYHKMNGFINKVSGKATKVDLREFLDLRQEFERVYKQREIWGLVNPKEKAFAKQLLGLANKINETELSTTVTRDMQLVKLQVDKLVAFNKYISDSNLKTEIFKLLSVDEPVGSVLDMIVNTPKKWFEIDELVGIPYFSQQCKNLLSEVESAKAVLELREDLITLSEREQCAVLDSLFGISKGIPENYAHMSTEQRKHFVEKVELWLNSNYGESKVSLDGFTVQASDFESDLYKNYSEEIQDPAIQSRIREFLKGGHLNPIKDVQKQMFQLILKDPDSVTHYNRLSKKQEVLFTDIETQGLNSSLHEITSVAMKSWVDIPENASLKEILDILEDSATEKTLKAYQTEDFIRNNITDEVLDVMFKNDLTVPNSREYRIEKYIKQYGAEANNKNYTEDNLLNDLILELDNSYTNMHKSVPVMVVHNNNGFDMDFIRKRCTVKKIYPEKIDHLSSLLEVSENTIARLKGLEDDMILTKESKDLIIQSVERCMDKMKYKDNMQLFSPERISDGLRMLDTRIEAAKVDWKDDPLLQSLKEYSDNGVFKEAHTSFKESSKDIMAELQMFKNNILANPYRIQLKNLGDDELKLYFSPDELDVIKQALRESDIATYRAYNEKLLSRYLKKNYKGYSKQDIDNLMRNIRRVNDTDIPLLGYKVLFDDVQVSKFFMVPEGTSCSEGQLRSMQEFAASITNTVNKRLQTNEFIEKYMDDYRVIIEHVKEYASHLELSERFSHFKYIEVPNTVNEAYVTAQKLWDTFGDEAFKEIVSEQGQCLLADTGKRYHYKIYKDVNRDYMTTFMTDIVRDNMAFRDMLFDVRHGIHHYKTASTLLEESKYTTLKDRTYLQAVSKYSELLEVLYETEFKYVKIFLKNISKEMDMRRQAMTAQILKYITASEDNLISHLMFHNQFLNIPLNGTKRHVTQVKQLIKKLNSYSSDKINFYVSDNFVHVSLAKGNVMEIIDDAIPDKETRMRFKGEEKEYIAPKYARIAVDTSYITDKRLARMYSEVNEQLYHLTGGTSAGSVGALHTFSKQKEMYSLLPEKFLRNAMTEDYTCHSRLWHGASFDMTNLGDLEHCWKYGKNNDIDPLIIMKENFDEIRGRVQSERVVLDTWFGDDSELRLSFLFSDLDIKQKLNTVRSMKDHVCVVLRKAQTKSKSAVREAQTASGYVVRELNITDELSLELAEKEGAIFVPYDMYLEMESMFNQSKVNNNVYKFFAKYTSLLKCGQIMFTGTWLRNYLDATIKAAGDAGSMSRTLRYQITAMHLINQYHKVIKYFEKTRGLSYKSMNAIRREFDRIPDISITYEQFEFLEGWFNSSISGGQSELVKAILGNSKGSRNVGLKQGRTDTFAGRRNAIQQFDAITSDIERFQDLDRIEVESLCNDLPYSDYVQHSMSKERFLEGFDDLNCLSDSEYIRWNQLAELLIQKRTKRLTHTSIVSQGVATFDNLISKALTPMSKVEELVRLGEYLALDAQGYKKGEIFKKITDSQFNYDVKDLPEKITELIIPFYTFEKANLIYWCRQISENPRMLRYIEHFWGELSWESSNISEEERMSNYALRAIVTSGNIPLGHSGLYLKTSPSFISALDYITGGPSNYISKLTVPLQLLSRAGLRHLGADSYALLSEVDLRELKFNDYMNLVPVAGTVWGKFDKAFNVTKDAEPTYLRLAEEAQDGWQGFLVRAFPSVFGAIKRFNSAGQLWDINQWKYVDKKDYISGGLNREWDFSKEGEWELYCKLIWNKHGLKWDNNQLAFVTPDEYIPGMLNDPNLSWDEVNHYNFVLHGRCYDSNQGTWVEAGGNYIAGGLNSNDLLWDELEAYQYVVHGRVWDYDKKAWVKVTEPKVIYQFQQNNDIVTAGIIRGDKESILSKLGVISPVYADTLYKAATTKTKAPLKDAKGRYVLTGDSEHDRKVFDLILLEYNSSKAVKGYSSNKSSYMHYHNGNAGGFKYKATSMMPSKTYRNSRVYYHGIRSGGKLYGKPYSAGHNLAGLRMATSNFTSYDIYYNYEYSYSYKYRNTIRAVADYPQTKLGVQRYIRMRGESLLKDFQNRNKADLGSTKSLQGLSLEQRLNKLKMHWWTR